MKPEEKPFLAIMQKLNLPAKSCLFIDNTQKNIDTARKLGMETMLFKNKKQFFLDIKKYLF
jgi:HAD superfamily hydrolase (TIGR01509 family)